VPSTGTLSATVFSGSLAASNITGTLGVANGGTGLTSLTANYIPYGNGTSALNSSSAFQFDGTNLKFGTNLTNGIYFGSSSQLNDYEVGTWTPSFYGWTGTYTTQLGTYVKIGKMVLLQATITTTGGSGTFSQTYPNILGLPFSIAYSGSTIFGQWVGVSNVSPGSTYLNGGVFDYGAATQFFINLTGIANTNIGNLTNTMLSNSSNVTIKITACYETT
jgi:hypothetical protein